MFASAFKASRRSSWALSLAAVSLGAAGEGGRQFVTEGVREGFKLCRREQQVDEFSFIKLAGHIVAEHFQVCARVVIEIPGHKQITIHNHLIFLDSSSCGPSPPPPLPGAMSLASP